MSNHLHSTMLSLNARQRESLKNALKENLRHNRVGHCSPVMFSFGVEGCVELLAAKFAMNGLPPPRSELKRMVVEVFRELAWLERPIHSQARSNGDKALAEMLTVLSGASTQNLVRKIVTFTPDIDGKDPSTMEYNDCVTWLRFLAIRATCLKGIGSYPAAILDCTSGLNFLDRRMANSTRPMLFSRMILSAILVMSKLRMGDVNVAFDDAIECCRAVLVPEDSSAVTNLVNATMASLTSTRDEVESTLSLPLGLDRAKRRYGHSPGCINTFSVLLRELSKCRQYHHVASGCERWVKSNLRCQDLIDLPEKFSPAPGIPVDSIFDGSDPPPLTVADASNIVKSSNGEVVHLYLVALFMQDRWEEAGFVLQHVAGSILYVPVGNYWAMLRALQLRSVGDRKFKSGCYHDASEAYKQSRNVFTLCPVEFCTCLLLEDEVRRLMATTLNYKIGKCRLEQLKHFDAIREFDKCLTDVQDFMEALEGSASCYRRLMDLSSNVSDVELRYEQAKNFYEKFIKKYESRNDSTYPNVCGITYPDRVDEATYRIIKSDLATLEKCKERALCAVAGPPPPLPPTPPAPSAHRPSSPTNSDTTSTFPLLDDATADAIAFFGMDPSTVTPTMLNDWLRANHPDKVPKKDKARATELVRECYVHRTLVLKYLKLRDAFNTLELDLNTTSMSAIDSAVRKKKKKRKKMDSGDGIRDDVVMVKTHVARTILDIQTGTVIRSRSVLHALFCHSCWFRSHDEYPEEYAAYKFLRSTIQADPTSPYHQR